MKQTVKIGLTSRPLSLMAGDSRRKRRVEEKSMASKIGVRSVVVMAQRLWSPVMCHLGWESSAASPNVVVRNIGIPRSTEQK
jgi:hypothetical protein